MDASPLQPVQLRAGVVVAQSCGYCVPPRVMPHQTGHPRCWSAVPSCNRSSRSRHTRGCSCGTCLRRRAGAARQAGAWASATSLLGATQNIRSKHACESLGARGCSCGACLHRHEMNSTAADSAAILQDCTWMHQCRSQYMAMVLATTPTLQPLRTQPPDSAHPWPGFAAGGPRRAGRRACRRGCVAAGAGGRHRAGRRGGHTAACRQGRSGSRCTCLSSLPQCPPVV